MKAYLTVTGRNNLDALFDDVVCFIGLFESKEEYSTPETRSIFSHYLLSSTTITESLTIEQEMENILPQTRIPNLNEYDEWFGSNRAVQSIFTIMFQYIFSGSRPSPLPKLPSSSHLISMQDLYFLKSNISSKQKYWELSFCSKRDGHSWASFVTRIQNSGPTIIIIKDNRGNVFGSYMGASIQKSAQVLFILKFNDKSL